MLFRSRTCLRSRIPGCELSFDYIDDDEFSARESGTKEQPDGSSKIVVLATHYGHYCTMLVSRPQVKGVENMSFIVVFPNNQPNLCIVQEIDTVWSYVSKSNLTGEMFWELEEDFEPLDMARDIIGHPHYTASGQQYKWTVEKGIEILPFFNFKEK